MRKPSDPMSEVLMPLAGTLLVLVDKSGAIAVGPLVEVGTPAEIGAWVDVEDLLVDEQMLLHDDLLELESATLVGPPFELGLVELCGVGAPFFLAPFESDWDDFWPAESSTGYFLPHMSSRQLKFF